MRGVTAIFISFYLIIYVPQTYLKATYRMTKQLPNTIRKRTELMEKQITCTQSDVNLLEPNISRTDNNNNNEISRVRIAARAIYLLCRASSDRASQLAANLN